MSTLTPTFNGTKWEVAQVIPNVTIEPYPQNNDANTTPIALKITPNIGYVLHDKSRDYTRRVAVTDENGNAVRDKNGNIFHNTIFYRGYTRGMATCGKNYDFASSEINLDREVTAYGNREFFAVPKNSVSKNQIW